MLGSTVIKGEIWDANRSVRRRGELNLGLLSTLAHALQSTLVGHDVDTARVLELAGQEVLQLQVDVLATESSVAVRGLDLEDAA
mmetsp:Transcript_19609/g.24214  ORF Transcript_19609/g.24214 Transcript_19609/m.24214 type:complete len:84 (-) Transcript_19609:508-759(-)